MTPLEQAKLGYQNSAIPSRDDFTEAIFLSGFVAGTQEKYPLIYPFTDTGHQTAWQYGITAGKQWRNEKNLSLEPPTITELG